MRYEPAQRGQPRQGVPSLRDGAASRRQLVWRACTCSRRKLVLRNVSFAIEPGEAVGLVGQNGAGKSTLLKLVTGTLQATEGSVHVNGRIAAILELGMGFNTELSGRQNVYHAAGLMGFSTAQVDQAISEIEAFAEIGPYFDYPVRTYSSGMQVRVAFAVATAFRPEILIVDEALSVGDVYFQHKCFERIRQFRQQGTTLLIVSHDRDSILALCDRAILLDKGRVLRDGGPEEVMDYYNALIADRKVRPLRFPRSLTAAYRPARAPARPASRRSPCMTRTVSRSKSSPWAIG